MNENKRLLALFGVVAVIVIVILVICFWPEPDKTFACKVKADADYEKIGSITYENYECLKDEDKFALVTKQDLSDKEKEALNETANQIGTGLYFLSEDLSKDELNDIKDDLGDDYKEDSLIIVEDGKITDVLKDKLSDSDAMLDFLEKANFAKWKFGAVADEEYSNLSHIDYDIYKKLYNSDDTFTIIFTQTTCGYCAQFKPVINEYAGDNNIPVYYLDIDTLNEDDSNELFSSVSYFSENSGWGTPTMLAIKDKKVISSLEGYTDDTSELDNFFETAKLK